MATSLSKLIEWFSAGKTPTGAQFSALFNSFWHKDEKIPISAIEEFNSINEAPDGGKYVRENGEWVEETAGFSGSYDDLSEKPESLQGDDGASAYEVAVSNGFVGTEVEWLAFLKGADGISAYEVAVSNGFSGSEVEWLASLEGVDGVPLDVEEIISNTNIEDLADVPTPISGKYFRRKEDGSGYEWVTVESSSEGVIISETIIEGDVNAASGDGVFKHVSKEIAKINVQPLTNRIVNPTFAGLPATGSLANWRPKSSADTYLAGDDGTMEFNAMTGTSTGMSYRTTSVPKLLDDFLYMVKVYIPEGGGRIGFSSTYYHSTGGYSMYNTKTYELLEGWHDVYYRKNFGTPNLSTTEITTSGTWDITLTTYAIGVKMLNPVLLIGADLSAYDLVELEIIANTERITTLENNTDELVLDPHFETVEDNGRGSRWFSNPITNTFTVKDGELTITDIAGSQVYGTRLDTFPNDNESFVYVVEVYVPAGGNVQLYSLVTTSGDNYNNHDEEVTIATEGWNKVMLTGLFGKNRPADVEITCWDLIINTTANGVKLRGASLRVAQNAQIGTSLNSKLIAMASSLNLLTRIGCVGDSLTAANFPTYLQSLLGDTYEVLNLGIGGESVPTIMARTGAVPMYISGSLTIPADTTTITLGTIADAPFQTLLGHAAKPVRPGVLYNPMYIGGIACTLGWTGSSDSDTTGEFTITRNEAGDARTLTDPIVHCATEKELGSVDIQVIFAETNGGFSSDEDLIEHVKKQTEFCASNKFIVISSHITNQVQREPLYLEAFGSKYINLREYMVNYGLSDAGLTPTDDDNISIAAGQCPNSLLIDGVHFTSEGYLLLAKQVYQKIVELGY